VRPVKGRWRKRILNEQEMLVWSEFHLAQKRKELRPLMFTVIDFRVLRKEFNLLHDGLLSQEKGLIYGVIIILLIIITS
jgi:hypothetical protein